MVSCHHHGTPSQLMIIFVKVISSQSNNWNIYQNSFVIYDNNCWCEGCWDSKNYQTLKPVNSNRSNTLQRFIYSKITENAILIGEMWFKNFSYVTLKFWIKISWMKRCLFTCERISIKLKSTLYYPLIPKYALLKITNNDFVPISTQVYHLKDLVNHLKIEIKCQWIN